MKGPEHYKVAELLMEEAKNPYLDKPDREHFIQMAQVHATLALASAASGTREHFQWEGVSR